MVQGSPRLDMLDLTIQDENLAQFRMPKDRNGSESAFPTGKRLEVSERDADSVEKMSDSPLLLPHTVQRIIFSYPLFS